MDNGDQVKRLLELEKEIQLLKHEIEEQQNQNALTKAWQRLLRFAAENSWLLSVIGAVVIGFWVFIIFGTSPWDAYQSARTSKNLSDTYQSIGDRLMVISEWQAAEDAYRQAWELNHDNETAQIRMLEARVFQPSAGEKTWVPAVVDARLTFLKQKYPNDYQVDYLTGIRYFSKGDYANARAAFQQSLTRNKNFIGGYIMLGYVNLLVGNIAEAEANLTEALKRDPDFGLTNNNLGALYLLTGRFAQAVPLLEKADAASPALSSLINLGEAYRYAGRAADAVRMHEYARWRMDTEALTDKERADDRYFNTETTYSFIALRGDDTTTIKNYVRIFDLDQKRAVIYYALAIDYALLGDFTRADEWFRQAEQIAGKAFPDIDRAYYLSLFDNRIAASKYWLNPNARIQQWFDQHKPGSTRP